MEIDRKELKRRARETMALTKPPFWQVALVYILMTSGVRLALTEAAVYTQSSTLGSFLQLLVQLYTVVVGFGLCLWSLWTYQQLDPGLGSLVQGFSVWGRVVLMNLGIYLRLLAWYFLVCFFLLLPVTMLAMTMPIPTMALPFAILAAGGAILAVWSIALRYSLAPYLLADHPDDGSGAAIRRSMELMRGWKWEMFKLEFSFLGWQLLVLVLTCLPTLYFLWHSGYFLLIETADPEAIYAAAQSVVNSPVVIALSNLCPLPVLLWLVPYRSVSIAGFYDARTQLQRTRSYLPPL